MTISNDSTTLPVGDFAALLKLEQSIESGVPYETMGHTILCAKAFPPRFKNDHGRTSSAQFAVNIWIGNKSAKVSAKHLYRRFAPSPSNDYLQMTPTEILLEILNFCIANHPDIR